MTDLPAIFSELKSLLQAYAPPLIPKMDTEHSFDLWSQKDLVIEGRKRKEVYFAGLIIQKSYVGFYFMPVYVETEMQTFFPPELLRHLKGKSCFHIKTLTPELREQIRTVLQSGFALYQQRGWV
ncbi:hypothetical protein [Levilinea saccharolytica]|nr:hypothetical protein [Levilinea saccharolytica]GAP17273.1 hypothetical protein LSAC_01141 [Levilinea saccharolytica]